MPQSFSGSSVVFSSFEQQASFFTPAHAGSSSNGAQQGVIEVLKTKAIRLYKNSFTWQI
jgi:hypothetical protein